MERKPIVTWQLWAVLGGLAFLILGVVRPAVCGRVWQERAMSEQVLAPLEQNLKKLGIEPAQSERPGGFCG
jgi:hypothetical protein